MVDLVVDSYLEKAGVDYGTDSIKPAIFVNKFCLTWKLNEIKHPTLRGNHLLF
jgi:hypothetical protein